MPFQPGHKLGAVPIGDRPLHRQNLALKVDKELYERIRAIPGWQQKLREELPEIVSKWEQGNFG